MLDGMVPFLHDSPSLTVFAKEQFYTKDFFKILRKRRTGCWVNEALMGVFGYSDVNFLVAPSLDALQEMLVT